MRRSLPCAIPSEYELFFPHDSGMKGVVTMSSRSSHLSFLDLVRQKAGILRAVTPY